MKHLKSSCPKDQFEHITKRADGRWIIRYYENETADGERMEFTRVIVSEKPTYEFIVDLLIREKYSVSDEFALQRQRESKPDDFAEYNDFCEACKAEAREITKEE